MNAQLHEDCFVSEPCRLGEPSSCPVQPGRERRALEIGIGWSALELRHEPGGYRHYLDGEPVHCGAGLELQAVEYRYDDYGSYDVPQQRAVLVRYEAKLHTETVSVSLHAGLDGHEFVGALEPWMRFRWPERQ